ncbi:MAG: hypothetical protein NDJ89_09350 [Oligoflexia bacterium]|nr:hypothetical protein [Oligoflexia bacterium]
MSKVYTLLVAVLFVGVNQASAANCPIRTGTVAATLNAPEDVQYRLNVTPDCGEVRIDTGLSGVAGNLSSRNFMVYSSRQKAAEKMDVPEALKNTGYLRAAFLENNRLVIETRVSRDAPIRREEFWIALNGVLFGAISNIGEKALSDSRSVSMNESKALQGGENEAVTSKQSFSTAGAAR